MSSSSSSTPPPPPPPTSPASGSPNGLSLLSTTATSSGHMLPIVHLPMQNHAQKHTQQTAQSKKQALSQPQPTQNMLSGLGVNTSEPMKITIPNTMNSLPTINPSTQTQSIALPSSDMSTNPSHILLCVADQLASHQRTISLPVPAHNYLQPQFDQVNNENYLNLILNHHQHQGALDLSAPKKVLRETNARNSLRAS